MTERPLLPLEDAIRAVLAEVPAPRTERIRIREARGLVLAEEVVSDVDMPPFDRSMMDGYAVRAADLVEVPAELTVGETVNAGDVPRLEVGPGGAARIMTGAPVPDGADAVVPVERTEALAGDRVRIDHSPRAGEHVAPRGEDARTGDVVLSSGRRVGPAEAGVLAAVGRTDPLVFARPRILVLTTGDEVVPAEERPGQGRIRNSNSPGLLARLDRDGARAENGGNIRDEIEATRSALEGAVGRYDAIVVTGGVSMGERDLVGRALGEIGFRQVFHKIKVKPGKPVLFGLAAGSLVFGLPGNPVSVAVTYELLVRPVVRTLLGLSPVHRTRVRATLTTEPPRALPREQYLPSALTLFPEPTVARLPWHGSGDLADFAGANALLVVPAAGPAPETGGEAEVLLLSDTIETYHPSGPR